MGVLGMGTCILWNNIHLDHSGGMSNRLKQLKHFMKLLSESRSIRREIICGDFNCFDLLKNGKEERIYQELLGSSFVDATSNIGWTADLNDIDTSMGSENFQKMIKLFKIHLRKKLDYVWLKNIKFKSCQR